MNQVLTLTDSGRSGTFFDKRLGTNLVAAALIGSGFWFNTAWSETLLNTGLFALSGAITNWLAIYMLFERVPGLYGSGVIPLHFEDFKTGINELIMHQFFNRENVEQFFANSANAQILPDFEAVFKKVNLNPAFDSLLEVIENSSFGPMLSMVGGVQALEPLREPFKEKLQGAVQKISKTEAFQEAMQEQLADLSVSEDILQKVEGIVTKRLNELTPNMVKDIVELMIQEHLGWLVVWGGVFGGLIGLISTFIF
ncbi:MAG: DUF445 domain-containing protein [SAR324 cluster bacterium]|nr:DUF445 domain-containing protein [SAR324 cluster bacterium]MBL7035986.1 DUF445 domain-containing protein [SAR324 cluster bacterium]